MTTSFNSGDGRRWVFDPTHTDCAELFAVARQSVLSDPAEMAEFLRDPARRADALSLLALDASANQRGTFDAALAEWLRSEDCGAAIQAFLAAVLGANEDVDLALKLAEVNATIFAAADEQARLACESGEPMQINFPLARDPV